MDWEGKGETRSRPTENPFGERSAAEIMVRRAIPIALGIILAAAVIGTARYVILQMQLRAAVTALEDIGAKAQQDMARIQERQLDEARRKEEFRRATLAKQAEQMRRQSEAAKFQERTSLRKQAAWQQFYSPPAKCDSPADWNVQVECGNKYVRAKRDFEAKWEDGVIE